MPDVSPKDRFVTVYGRNPVIEVLDDHNLTVDKVVLAEGAHGHGIGEILGLARDRGVPVQRASSRVRSHGLPCNAGRAGR